MLEWHSLADRRVEATRLPLPMQANVPLIAVLREWPPFVEGRRLADRITGLPTGKPDRSNSYVVSDSQKADLLKYSADSLRHLEICSRFASFAVCTLRLRWSFQWQTLDHPPAIWTHQPWPSTSSLIAVLVDPMSPRSNRVSEQRTIQGFPLPSEHTAAMQTVIGLLYLTFMLGGIGRTGRCWGYGGIGKVGAVKGLSFQTDPLPSVQWRAVARHCFRALCSCG